MSTNPAGTVEFGRRETPPATTGIDPATYTAPPAAPIVPKTANEALRPEPGAPPPPPMFARRSRGSRNQFVVFLNFLMSLIVFVVIAAGAFFIFGKRTFDGPGPLVGGRDISSCGRTAASRRSQPIWKPRG